MLCFASELNYNNFLTTPVMDTPVFSFTSNILDNSQSITAQTPVPVQDESQSKVSARINQRNITTRIEKNLFNKLCVLRSKLSKYRNKVRKQAVSLKAAKKILSNPSFLKIMDSLPISAMLLKMMQIWEYKKKDKGRRFRLKEKILAFTMFKQSPKGYRFLRKNIIRPAPQTLIKLVLATRSKYSTWCK